jgi:hypothetical protein
MDKLTEYVITYTRPDTANVLCRKTYRAQDAETVVKLFTDIHHEAEWHAVYELIPKLVRGGEG